MAAKTLRIVRDSKYTGIFTRSQIEHAISVVERTSARGDNAPRGQGGSAKSAAKRPPSAKR